MIGSLYLLAWQSSHVLLYITYVDSRQPIVLSSDKVIIIPNIMSRYEDIKW